MTDSINILDSDIVQRIHGARSSGKLYKGHGIVQANTSIPTKYQTIFIENGDRRGFGSTAKRFDVNSSSKEIPGPAHYLSHQSAHKHNPSDSKHGTGGFASKTKRRVELGTSGLPPPNIYHLPSHLQSRRDFRTSEYTRQFMKPIAERRKDPRDNELPAPNEYDISRLPRRRANNVTADAAFKSSSKREVINVSEARKMPAPGQYEIKDELTRESARAPVSCFRSRSNRNYQVINQAPGPGAYHPWETVEPAKKQEFPKKHFLCISAPAIPLPETPPSPGPGQYEVNGHISPSKHYMSSSMFVSSTSRWTGAAQPDSAETPGPAHYKPLNPTKQSFIYNSTSKWI